MKLTEITKGEFVTGLKDPAAKEISDIANELNKSASRGYSFYAHNPDKELSTIIGNPPSMDIEPQVGNLIEYIKKVISTSTYWNYKTWQGDVENGEFAVYVVRKA